MKLGDTFCHEAEEYGVIFKLKLSDKHAFRVNITGLRALNQFPQKYSENPKINNAFKSLKQDELFIYTGNKGFDFKAVIKKSYQRISEVIDVNILHQSENSIVVENQAFVFHRSSHRFRIEPLEEKLDGYYAYEQEGFERFSNNYLRLPTNSSVRDKIRSAIRFYKLGNESTELEHKILNYWIGFEQLYSSEFSDEDSIKRIKTFFTALNSSFYLQRRTNYLLGTLKRFNILYKEVPVSKEHLFSEQTMQEIKGLCANIPLAYYRMEKYIELFHRRGEIKKTLSTHHDRLEQHLTRIYRIRNEIVHEGQVSTNLELVAGHLRHYLLFSIEQITHTMAEFDVLLTLEDVFIYYENLFEQLKSSSNIEVVFNVCSYQGYME